VAQELDLLTAVVPVIFSVSVFCQYSRCVGKISSFMVPPSKNISPCWSGSIGSLFVEPKKY